MGTVRFPSMHTQSACDVNDVVGFSLGTTRKGGLHSKSSTWISLKAHTCRSIKYPRELSHMAMKTLMWSHWGGGGRLLPRLAASAKMLHHATIKVLQCIDQDIHTILSSHVLMFFLNAIPRIFVVTICVTKAGCGTWDRVSQKQKIWREHA